MGPIPRNMGTGEAAIGGIISALHDLVDNIESGRTGCNFECDLIRLGALRKQLKSRCLLNPRPSNPYLGYSFSRICQSLRKIGIPPVYDYDNMYHYHRNPSRHVFRIKPTIRSIIEKNEESIEEMRIDRYW